MKTKQTTYECIQPPKKRQSYFGCKKVNVDKKCTTQNGSKQCSKLIILTPE